MRAALEVDLEAPRAGRAGREEGGLEFVGEVLGVSVSGDGVGGKGGRD